MYSLSMHFFLCIVVSSLTEFCYYSDLFTTFGKQVVELLNDKPGVMKLLNEGKQSRNQRTKTLSLWALKELKKLT